MFTTLMLLAPLTFASEVQTTQSGNDEVEPLASESCGGHYIVIGAQAPATATSLVKLTFEFPALVDLGAELEELDLVGMMDGDALVVEDADVIGLVELENDVWYEVTDGPIAQTREHVLLSRQVDVPASTGLLELRVDAVQFREVPVPGTRTTQRVMDLELGLDALVETTAAGEELLWTADASTCIGSSTRGGSGAGKVKFDRLSIKKYSDTARSDFSVEIDLGDHLPTSAGR